MLILIQSTKRFLLTFIPLFGMLIGLPLLGVWIAGLPVEPYFEFPPQTRYVRPAPFSGAVFAAVAALIAVTVIPLASRGIEAYRQSPAPPALRRWPFPWWGWSGLAAGAAGWALAWTRLPWMAGLQPHTFTPLWLAYIVVVNALCHRRTGRSLLTHRPLFLLGLFPASAVFWWFFEYLNRFVQNWYYTGAAFGPWDYFWYATLPFATVLPAVISTREFVRSAGWLQRAFARTRPVGVS